MLEPETNQATERVEHCPECGVVMNEPMVGYFTCPNCGADKHTNVEGADASSVTMEEARNHWSMHTRHVLTKDARDALRGAEWCMEGATPVMKGKGLSLVFKRRGKGVFAEARWGL